MELSITSPSVQTKVIVREHQIGQEKFNELSLLGINVKIFPP